LKLWRQWPQLPDQHRAVSQPVPVIENCRLVERDPLADRPHISRPKPDPAEPPLEAPGPKTRRGGATYRGSVPATDPRYQSGWNFLSGKNLNQPSGKASTETETETET